MSTLDIFKADAFSLRSLSAAISQVPFVPSRLGQLGLFRNFGIPTTTAQIEVQDNVLYLVPAKPRNAAATPNKENVRKMVPINTVHLPVADRISSDELQNHRAFGTPATLESLQAKVTGKLTTIRQSFEATLEHHRVGAIKGQVLDADGISVLYDLYSIFEVSKAPVVNFNFLEATPPTGKVRTLISGVQRYVEDELGALPYQYLHCFCGERFIDDLVSLEETRKAWTDWQQGEWLRGQTARRTFWYAGVMFEEYRGKVGGVSYFGEDEAHFVPIGVPGLFDCAYGPSTFMSDVNTDGAPLYAKVTPDARDRWVDLDAQSNPVHYCTRPSALVQATGRTS